MDRKPIFDAVRAMLGRGFARAQIEALDRACDAAESAAGPWKLGPAGAALIKRWEDCAARQPDGTFRAYPDPGNPNGLPWTIGWGATGAGIAEGTVWTQAQCDARFNEDITRFVREVAQAIGSAPTTQNQFDALVAFHYNTGKIASATLTRLHRQGDYAGARAEFGKWIYSNRKPMNGLRRRRTAEAALYAAP